MHRFRIPTSRAHSLLALFCLSLLPMPMALGQPGGISKLYVDNCAKCHGERGQGGGAGTQTLLNDEFLDQSRDRPYFNAIKNGLPENGMPGFADTMPDAQIWGLVNYLRELQQADRRQRVGSISKKLDENGLVKTQHHRYRIQTVVDTSAGLRVPWSVEFIPEKNVDMVGGRMLTAERPGAIRIHTTGKPDGSLSEPIIGTPAVRNRGQGGLMDIALHPNFSDNGWIYLAYSDELEGTGRSMGMTKVVRGKIQTHGENGKKAWTEQQTIFEAKPEHYLSTDLHFGSRVVFDPKDPSILFFAIGERGMMDMAQDLTRPNGKVHRVGDDGRILADNPFADAKYTAMGVYPSIWSFGHRNPQGVVFDLEGNLWDTEHGPRGGDELNLVVKGLNYGWPVVSYGINYNGAAFRTPWFDTDGDGPAKRLESLAKPAEAFEGQTIAARLKAIAMPVDRWLPSVGVCGLTVVDVPGPKIDEDAKGALKDRAVFKEAAGAFTAWEGDLLAGGLSGASVDRFRVRRKQAEPEVSTNAVAFHDGTPADFEVVEREEIVHGLGRVRDVVCGLDGTVYVVLNDPDIIIRLVAE